jgi:hypothetical protein
MAVRTVVIVTLGTAAVGALGYFAYRTFEARRVGDETNRLARVLALEPTSHVADVGAGNGAFSLELASRIRPQGTGVCHRDRAGGSRGNWRQSNGR